jgi:hypothetical protein
MPFDWKNPWILGGAGLLLILLVFFRGSGTASTGTGAAGVASQSEADAANISLAGLSTQQNIASIDANSALGVAESGDTASILGAAFGYLSNMGANATSIANTQAGVTANFNTGMTTTQQLVIAGENNVKGIDATMAGNLSLAQENDATTIRVNGDNNALMATLSPELATINASSNQALAQISANTATTVAGINANEALSAAQVSAQASGAASTSNGIFGMLGNIFGGITRPGGGATSGPNASLLGAGIGALAAL